MAVAIFDPGALERFARTFESLFNSGNAAAMTSYYTEDAQLMGEGMTPIRGQGSILEFWRTAIGRASAAGARRTIEVHESASSGDLGYALCTVTVQVSGTRIASWDATVWQRGPSGEWRIAVDISTRIAPGG
jgi:ketosteroid isomerase-like protein